MRFKKLLNYRDLLAGAAGRRRHAGDGRGADWRRRDARRRAHRPVAAAAEQDPLLHEPARRHEPGDAADALRTVRFRFDLAF